MIVAQLMHVGRVAHADNTVGAETIAPNIVQMITDGGPEGDAVRGQESRSKIIAMPMPPPDTHRLEVELLVGTT
jgi:hypothetical protein